jgi:hypothetical protein
MSAAMRSPPPDLNRSVVLPQWGQTTTTTGSYSALFSASRKRPLQRGQS